MKRLSIFALALLFACHGANGQGLLRNLGERAKSVVENKVAEKVENAVSKTVDKAANKAEEKLKGKKTGQQSVQPAEQKAEEPAMETKPAKKVASSFAKSDFVPGDEVFFEDNFENEKLGEFPSRWELLDGYAEVASFAGRKVIAFTDEGLGSVGPLMKDRQAWLPDVFTVEYDIYVCEINPDAGESMLFSIRFEAGGHDSGVDFYFREDGSSWMQWTICTPEGRTSGGQKDLSAGENNPLIPGEWNHFALSFNKRAFKGYLNGIRVINAPSMAAPVRFYFNSSGKYPYNGISNVRLAKGAVPLYDRLMSDGKIITYAITFETGKADLKPESMVEINRIAKLMKENPNLSFEVQGHCDATGSDKVNDPLSQRRAEAIVSALVDLDIAEARLKPVGKGSHSPIASNSTEEGRAKNRRVEFVKQ